MRSTTEGLKGLDLPTDEFFALLKLVNPYLTVLALFLRWSGNKLPLLYFFNGMHRNLIAFPLVIPEYLTVERGPPNVSLQGG